MAGRLSAEPPGTPCGGWRPASVALAPPWAVVMLLARWRPSAGGASAPSAPEAGGGAAAPRASSDARSGPGPSGGSLMRGLAAARPCPAHISTSVR
jgi:hypothetical protein